MWCRPVNLIFIFVVGTTKFLTTSPKTVIIFTEIGNDLSIIPDLMPTVPVIFVSRVSGLLPLKFTSIAFINVTSSWEGIDPPSISVSITTVPSGVFVINLKSFVISSLPFGL